MARPSTRNPLNCYLRRQIDDRTNHCKRLVSARIDNSENLFRKDLLSHYGCVNAIEFSPQGDLLISGKTPYTLPHHEFVVISLLPLIRSLLLLLLLRSSDQSKYTYATSKL